MIEKPIPEAAPVTRATLPCTSNSSGLGVAISTHFSAHSTVERARERGKKPQECNEDCQTE